MSGAARPQVQLHRLEGFFWVARTGGYARAARAFPYPITQPAVHAQVKKLEEELGTALFERVAKDRMAPTPAGQRLYDFVRPFFESLPSVVRSIQGGEFGGELRVSTSGLLVRHLVPGWIRALHAAHPEVAVHLEETGDDAVDLLRQGQVDLAIDHLYEVPDDIATMAVAVLHPIVAVPRGHAAAAGDGLDLEPLGDTPFVAYAPGQRARELQFAALTEHDLSPRSMLSATSAEGILGFVGAGLGWSILPWLDGQGPTDEHVDWRPLEDPEVRFEVVAAWRKDTPENPLLDAMLEAAPRL